MAKIYNISSFISSLMCEYYPPSCECVCVCVCERERERERERESVCVCVQILIKLIIYEVHIFTIFGTPYMNRYNI